MGNMDTVDILYELLQSGDEALDFLCGSSNIESLETCINICISLTDLYDNIAAFIENNNIDEKHRSREAALNAAIATEKLRKTYNENNLSGIEICLYYELIPLHIFLKNEVYFWFGTYPDMAKMYETRDALLETMHECFKQHRATLKLDYPYDVSIMVLCFNKVYLTKKAFDSIIKYTDFDKHKVEIIIINNGSSDNGETSAFLKEINDPHIKTVDLMHPLGYNGY